MYFNLEKIDKNLGFETDLQWTNIFILGFIHIFGVYWCYDYAFPAKWQTIAFAMWMYLFVGSQGISSGVHRLWTHRSYKATLPLRIWLMICWASTGQNTIYNWVRDHRLHHKFSDTAADPHDSSRGFWFSHIGWLLMKKNSLVREKGKLIDMTDIKSDPVAMFQYKHAVLLKLMLCYFLPTITGILLWNEKWQCAIAWQCFIRVLLVFHAEMTVNSFAQKFGYKPYNKNIKPTLNIFVSAVTMGDGYHNFHHMFPNDYKSAETFDVLNLSTFMIRFWAKIGLAYDLKEASPQLIQAVVKSNVEHLMDSEKEHQELKAD